MITLAANYKTLTYDIASDEQVSADVGVVGVGERVFVPGGPTKLRQWDFNEQVQVLKIFDSDNEIVAQSAQEDATNKRLALLSKVTGGGINLSYYEDVSSNQLDISTAFKLGIKIEDSDSVVTTAKLSVLLGQNNLVMVCAAVET